MLFLKCVFKCLLKVAGYPYTYNLNTLGSLILFFSYAANKPTHKQTDGLERPTHADRHSRRG